MKTAKFRVAEEVQMLGVKSRAFVISGIAIPSTYSPQLFVELDERQAELRASVDIENLKHETYLKSFRDVHKMVGRSARTEIAAPEALLRLLLRRGQLPRINPLVDIYNLVSAESRLALGAHDTSHVTGNVALKITDGTETFVPLGAEVPEALPAGEYAYCDEDEVICRLEVRQCDKSKVTNTTTECMFFLHGSPLHSVDTLDRAAESLWALVERHCAATQMTVVADE